MNEPKQPNPAEPSPALLAAIEKILRPLVKLMLACNITYPQLIGLLKSIFVDVAEKDFRVDGRPQTDSRINLLTGVHRKDVKRLRTAPKQASQAPANVSVGARVIGQWLGSREFLDERGNPRPLALKRRDTGPAGFEELVVNVCKQNIRPRVLLDEWLSLGVARVEDDHVVLNTGAFTPEKGFDEKVFFFGKNTQDHINAGSHNLLGLKPSYFDRSVYYDRLSRASIEALAQRADKLGMQALTEMNREALARQQEDAGQANANYRMNFGIFNFSTEITPREAAGQGEVAGEVAEGTAEQQAAQETPQRPPAAAAADEANNGN